MNTVFGKIVRLASEEVIMELKKVYTCLALRHRMLFLNYSGCQIAWLYCNPFPNETV